jgi:hypothetical protein
MNTRPTKPRGPIGWLKARLDWLEARTWRFWTAFAVLAVIAYPFAYWVWLWIDWSYDPPIPLVYFLHYVFWPCRWLQAHGPDWYGDCCWWFMAHGLEYEQPRLPDHWPKQP